MNKKQGLTLTMLILGFLLLLNSCTTVPITNRRQFTLIPDGEMLNLSQSQYNQVLQESQLSTNQTQKAMLNKVGKRIAAAVDEFYREKGMENNFRWEFNLVKDDDMVNAWAMPGGKIAFYTGILKYTQDESGIAAVMGHEVAHVIAKHGNERMSQGMIAEVGSTALSAALQNKPQQTQQIFTTAFGLGTKLGVILPFSRLQESEADEIGLILMAKAGYDPHHAISFWQRMSQSGKGAPPEFLSTHPSDQRRIQDLRKHLPEALSHYKTPALPSQSDPSPGERKKIDWRRTK